MSNDNDNFNRLADEAAYFGAQDAAQAELAELRAELDAANEAMREFRLAEQSKHDELVGVVAESRLLRQQLANSDGQCVVLAERLDTLESHLRSIFEDGSGHAFLCNWGQWKSGNDAWIGEPECNCPVQYLMSDERYERGR